MAEQKVTRRIPEIAGMIARWYARQRGSASQLDEYRAAAGNLTEGLPAGADVLEVAPGPGYLAIEIARLGRFRVTGLDISRTFVQIASEEATRAGVTVDFRHGDASALPFDAGSFDLIVCQAAFKNFRQPGRAIAEMHRVLRPGGTAVIQDMSRDATGADVDAEVGRMRLPWLSGTMIRFTLRMLRRRAYSRSRFTALVAASPFGTGDIRADGITLEVRLTKA